VYREWLVQTRALLCGVGWTGETPVAPHSIVRVVIVLVVPGVGPLKPLAHDDEHRLLVPRK
jgi:hypothetical protein